MFTHSLFAHGALVGVSRRLVVVGVRDEACTHSENSERLNLQVGRRSVETRKEGNVLFKRRTQHILFTVIWKEGNVLFNDALNTFYLQLYGRKEMFYLTTHSTHFIYSYMEGRKCFI